MDKHTLSHLLREYKTPMYCFDIVKLKHRINSLKSQLPPSVKMCYAAKANTFILKEIEDDIDFYEICSPGELDICHHLHIPMKKIVLSGVYKNKDDIQKLLDDDDEIGVYTIESLQQLLDLARLSENYCRPLPVLIRLTSGNQFGVDKESLRYIIENRQHYPYLQIRGIQYFSGTQKHSIKRLEKEMTMLLNLIAELQEFYGYHCEVLEYGPGLPIDYFDGTDFDEKSHLLQFSKLLLSVPEDIEVVLEIGRSIAAECGYYLTKVVDIKINNDQSFAIVDGGIHHLTYYGQSMAMKVPQLEVYRQDSEEFMNLEVSENKWNICGSLCTINDILIKQLSLEELRLEDLFIFKNTGAYCPTEGISLFLTRDLPDIIFIKKDHIQSVRLMKKTSFFNEPQYVDFEEEKKNG